MTLSSFLLSTATVVSCVMYLRSGAVSMYDSLVIPAHATQEVVYREHRDVHNKIEAIIRISPTLDVVERRVRSAIWPRKVMRVAVSAHVEGETETPEEAIKKAKGFSKVAWTNMKTVIRNGAGYGSIVTDQGQVHIVIIDNVCQSLGRGKVHYTIYIETPRQKQHL